MTHEEKRAWVEKEIGTEILYGCDEDCFNHTYKAMHDYGMSLGESDRWAWLNTLFGYDIGADRALKIITWYDDNALDVYDLEADEWKAVQSVCEMELGLHLDFSCGWSAETPKYIQYTWPEHL